MKEEARRLDLRVVLAIAFLVAAIWAATALARGPDQASSDADAGNSPAAVYLQSESDGGTQGEGSPAPGEDCPERDGGGGNNGGDGSPDV